MGFIIPRVGAQQHGYNLTDLPSGKRAFPFHNHRVNEEMFFVIEGEGRLPHIHAKYAAFDTSSGIMAANILSGNCL